MDGLKELSLRWSNLMGPFDDPRGEVEREAGEDHDSENHAKYGA